MHLSSSKPILVFSAVLVFTCATALAVTEGPWRRTCRINGGTPWDIRLEDDQITLCRFGVLGVDAETFYNQVEGESSPQAVSAFLSQTGPGPASPRIACENNGGTFIPVADLENVATSLCRFGDNSQIEARALSVGSGPGPGAPLAHALQR